MDPKAAILEALNAWLGRDVPLAAGRLAGYQEWRRAGGYEPALEASVYATLAEIFHSETCPSPSADLLAMAIYVLLQRDCAEYGIDFEELTPAVLDRIEDVFSPSEE